MKPFWTIWDGFEMILKSFKSFMYLRKLVQSNLEMSKMRLNTIMEIWMILILTTTQHKSKPFWRLWDSFKMILKSFE